VLCIIQPYFLPFIGYFQLINKCDVAVIFDDVKFQKKGYSVKTKYDDKISISINIQNRSKQELIYQKKISKEYYFNIQKLKKSILQKNPIFFDELLFDELFFLPDDRSYFNFIFKQIKIICNKLKINTKILKSSEVIDTTHFIKQEKIFAICKTLDKKKYLNSIGGKKLYGKDEFLRNGINLNFFNYNPYISGKYNDNSILNLIFNFKIDDIIKSLE
jgi:hypothetical protein